MSAPDRPTIAVIVPCYNLGQYLEEALDSVFAQTFQDFEICVVNDGSTDAYTNTLISRLNRPKTKVITVENGGLAAARNRGIKATSGRYLCALDADDKLAPTYFERAVPILDRDPATAFVSTWLQTFGTEQWTWKPDRCDLPMLLAECTVSTAALVRREAVAAVGGYRANMPEPGYEDWDLWISLAERGYQGVILPEPLFYYRKRSNSMSDRCCRGEAHLALMRDLVEHHEASYRRYAYEVFIDKEHRLAALAGEIDSVGRQLATLQQMAEHKSRERDRLSARLRQLPGGDQPASSQLRRLHAENESLRQSIAHAERELSALRRSISWKATAPARWVGQVLLNVLRAARRGKGRS